MFYGTVIDMEGTTMATEQITRQCGECEGRGSVGYCYEGSADFDVAKCEACGGTGAALAFCDEPHPAPVPATHVIDSEISLCTACYHRCGICTFATPADDRLPLPTGPGVAHAACLMALDVPVPALPSSAAAAVENRQDPGDNKITGAASAAYANTHAAEWSGTPGGRRGGRRVPKIADDLARQMRAKGYVSVTEAARTTGHSDEGVRGWVESRRVQHTRSGIFVFVLIEDIVRICPHAAEALRSGRAA